MGKCTEPSVRVAVPSTPGVRPRLVRALGKPASSLTEVLLPDREAMVATGAVSLALLELPLLQAARLRVAMTAATPRAAYLLSLFIRECPLDYVRVPAIRE